MKNSAHPLLAGILLALNCSTLGLPAQSSVITYQGSLSDHGQPATGTYDLRFSVFTVESGGDPVGDVIDKNAVAIAEGLFTAHLDFAPEVFAGGDRWLEIEVRPAGGAGDFTNLTPRQLLSAVPYAVKALEATSVPAGAITGAMLADGSVTGAKLAPEALNRVVGNVQVDQASRFDVNAAVVELGTGTTASGGHATAFGWSTTASGESSTSAGYNTRASGDYSTALGWNSVAGGYAATAMGDSTAARAYASTAMGDSTMAIGVGATAMGFETTAAGLYATSMGQLSRAYGSAATAMGFDSFAAGEYSVAGGRRSTASQWGSIALGVDTTASGRAAAAFGEGTWSGGVAALASGDSSFALGDYSVALGQLATAGHAGTFVWSDSSGSEVASMNANSLTFRAAGGYRLFTDATATTGASLASGAPAWSANLDRTTRTNLSPVNVREVLDRVLTLPLHHWRYPWESTNATPHLGPTAQEFKAAFYPGRPNTGVTTLEFDGVTLAALQGLNRKLEEELKRSGDSSESLASRLAQRDAEMAELKRQNTELLRRLEAVEKRLK